MFKKIKKQEGANQTGVPVPKFSQEELVLSSNSFFSILEQPLLISQMAYSFYKGAFTTNYQCSIFHPPGA